MRLPLSWFGYHLQWNFVSDIWKCFRYCYSYWYTCLLVLGLGDHCSFLPKYCPEPALLIV
uniref:Uncharacterized protein n=1 Tax=Rhizophora mucronata TaxID=61149 RepID=A0A2P2Q3B7_RHIMU